MVLESNCISFSKLVGSVALEAEVLSAEHTSKISPSVLQAGHPKSVTTTDNGVTGNYGLSVHNYIGKALWAEYHSQQKKERYIIPFRQSSTGVTSCKYVFRTYSLPGGRQLLLLETVILSHHTSDSLIVGPSTTIHKTYGVPPILEAWNTAQANKELSEVSVATPYIRSPRQAGISWAQESYPRYVQVTVQQSAAKSAELTKLHVATHF